MLEIFHSRQALFSDDCDTVHVEWATDRNGRRKAFAFVTIKPEEKATEIISKLNGSEMLGRTLRVDLSKPSGGRNNSNRGGNKSDSGGKSARELRALREEEEDAKKKRRRPKKD